MLPTPSKKAVSRVFDGIPSAFTVSLTKVALKVRVPAFTGTRTLRCESGSCPVPWTCLPARGSAGGGERSKLLIRRGGGWGRGGIAVVAVSLKKKKKRVLTSSIVIM